MGVEGGGDTLFKLRLGHFISLKFVKSQNHLPLYNLNNSFVSPQKGVEKIISIVCSMSPI